MVNLAKKLKDYRYAFSTNFRIMWRTVSGKVGIISALIFVVLGVFALVAYYPGEAHNYESAKIMWRYVNTPNAPPCWAVSQKYDKRMELKPQDLSYASNVSIVEQRSKLTGRLQGYAISYTAIYTAQLDLSDMKSFPGEGLLLLHIKAYDPPGITLSQPLRAVVSLHRPDGSTILLFNSTVQTGSETTIFGSVLGSGNQTGGETPIIISNIPPNDPKYKALFDSLYELYPKQLVDSIIHTEVQGNATTGQTAQKEIYSLLDLMLGTYAQENNKTVVKPLPGIYTFEVTLVYKTGLIQAGEINPQNISFKDYIGINKF
ncbi:MAG: hypothetical protein F7C32_00045, partial [Desulfurococcales archaeon]|nr:hypothetical protein [Desulfurococcales archaeon]